MYLLNKPIGIMALAAYAACLPAMSEQSPLVLHDNKPAKRWDHGYGTGNGRVSALTFGGYPKDTIVLNEGSIFEKQPFTIPDGAKKAVAEARKLCDEGKFRQADDVFRSRILTNASVSGNYSQGGLLDVAILDAPEMKSYSRRLDMAQGKAISEIEVEGGKILTELLCAPLKDCVAYRISTKLKKGLSVSLKLRHPRLHASSDGNNTLVLKGRAGNDGTGFETRLLIQAPGARIEISGNEAVISNAHEIFVFSSTATDYNIRRPSEPLKHDLSALNKKNLAAGMKAGWQLLEAETSAHFSRLMGRCSVDIGDSPEDVRLLTTKDRIERMKKGGTDPDLTEQLFQFGRYCIISNSRPGGLPCGLQGLWNPDLTAAWRGCYFFNINCEMNYWPAETTGLGEYHRALTDFICGLKEEGEQFSKAIGYEGFCFGHNTDCWGKTYFSGNNPEWAASLMNGAWVCSHLVEHYHFNGDKNYLAKCLPILESNARFVLSWFKPHPETGEYLSGPGVSPETGFFIEDETGKNILCYISNGNSHDLLLGREALRNYIYVCKQLGVAPPLVKQASAVLEKIPLPGIGSDGRLMEWRQEFQEQQKRHRHFSHLYGLFPGNEFDVIKTPRYAEAIRKSLDYRLKHGSGHTGWSEAWMINLYATLGEGNKCNELMDRMLTHRISPNLFDMHPPFQIDGNFGFTAGLAQCLIQSQIEQDGRRVVQLLPARADIWKKGSAKGLKTRGGLTVNLEWENGGLKATVHASRPGQFRFIHKEQKKDVTLKEDETIRLQFP